MRIYAQDFTLSRNNNHQYLFFLIKEYEQIKETKHPKYKFVKDFYHAFDRDRSCFLKHYNRFKQRGNNSNLLPVNLLLVNRTGRNLIAGYSYFIRSAQFRIVRTKKPHCYFFSQNFLFLCNQFFNTFKPCL